MLAIVGITNKDDDVTQYVSLWLKRWPTKFPTRIKLWLIVFSDENGRWSWVSTANNGGGGLISVLTKIRCECQNGYEREREIEKCFIFYFSFNHKII